MAIRMPHHGARPHDVVDGVLSRYLVQTTYERIVAYRRYRENSVGYFKADDLSRLHWEYLHGQAAALPEQDASDLPPESRRFPKTSHKNRTKVSQLALENIRRGLAATLEVSEHSIEMSGSRPLGGGQHRRPSIYARQKDFGGGNNLKHTSW